MNTAAAGYFRFFRLTTTLPCSSFTLMPARSVCALRDRHFCSVVSFLGFALAGFFFTATCIPSFQLSRATP